MEVITQLVALLCVFLLMIMGFYFVYSLMFSTPFYPSVTKRLNIALTYWKDLGINPLNQEKAKFVDLGSGDGRVVFWAARNGFIATGIELNPYLSLLSKLIKFLKRINNARIINMSFYKHNFSDYDIAYLYIYPEHMEKMKDKLFREMKNGAVIISNTFKFKNLEPEQSYDRFHLYRIKK